MKQCEFGKRLIKYITEAARTNQTKLAADLGYSQQAFNSRIRRGSLPLAQVLKWMKDNNVEVPIWAHEGLNYAPSNLMEEVKKLRAENQHLEERLKAAEQQQEKLMEMLRLSLTK